MTVIRYAVRALALSLSLTAVGALHVIGTPAVVHAAGDAPVGGTQLSQEGVIVNLGPGVPAPPAMPGASFLVADLQSGQILAARAPHLSRLPASTLKTLTALTLIPRLDANAKVVVLPADVSVEGSRIGVLAGTAYTVRSLFQGLLMASGNDAAYALARANGSLVATVAEMNAKAAGLGAFDTVAKDPSGLDRPGQTTSAYDLGLIARAAMRLPDFRTYVSTRQASFPGGRSQGVMKPGFKINNHNTLLYNYQGAIGIKNGYTVAAEQTFVGAATRGDKTYLVTQLSSANGGWRPTAALLDWAFAHGASMTPVGTLVEPGTATPPGQTSAVGAHPGSAPSPAPRDTALSTAFPPWAGIIGLVGVMTAAGALRRRYVAQKRSSRRRLARGRS